VAKKRSEATKVTTDVPFSENPVTWAWNKLTPKSWNVSEKVGQDLPSVVTNNQFGAVRPGMEGAAVNASERLFAAQKNYEAELLSRLTQEITDTYGTPFTAAAKLANQIVASRKKGASGNWPS
jgi:hypothetical protein